MKIMERRGFNTPFFSYKKSTKKLESIKKDLSFSKIYYKLL